MNYNLPNPQYAVAAIRVSTLKQGMDGDSPEAQREQIERFAISRNYRVKKIFLFLESASKEQQPMQEAIDYCKKRGNKVEIFIVKSIDRFTRGGSHSYSSLKLQLEKCNVRLVDIYGVIGQHQVNTLEHLGFSYDWSVYDPTKNSEILEAERAKDEKRDIMSRMIGAQIRYSQLGYWMRRPPYGYKSEYVETRNGKRPILVPHPKEAPYIVKMFELRARGSMTDLQIVDELNTLGYRTRTQVKRSKINRYKVIGRTGGNKLSIKVLQRTVRSPIYAGVNVEKWTDGQPVKCKFKGLVTIDRFNKANRLKVTIHENEDGVQFSDTRTHYRPSASSEKHLRSSEYPYRRVVMCPVCEKALFGSASRGKGGKYYPAYHCYRGEHSFRVPKAAFNETIMNFANSIQITLKCFDQILAAVTAEWKKRFIEIQNSEAILDIRTRELNEEVKMIMESLRHLRSDVMVSYSEQELLDIDKEETRILKEKQKLAGQLPDLDSTIKYTKIALKDIGRLLYNGHTTHSKAACFSLIFNELPTYQELIEIQADEALASRIFSKVFQLKV